MQLFAFWRDQIQMLYRSLDALIASDARRHAADRSKMVGQLRHLSRALRAEHALPIPREDRAYAFAGALQQFEDTTTRLHDAKLLDEIADGLRSARTAILELQDVLARVFSFDLVCGQCAKVLSSAPTEVANKSYCAECAAEMVSKQDARPGTPAITPAVPRTTDIVMPSSQPEQMQDQVDIAVITILPEEYQAVLACLDEHRFVRGTSAQPNVYSWEVGAVVSGTDRYRIAVALAGDPTNAVGAVATLATIQRFAPRYVALVGVAGGLVAEGQDRGDVVVSKVIYGYEYGKIDGGFQPRTDFTHRVDIELSNAAQAYVATGEQWWSTVQAQPPQPKANWGVRIGAVASGNKVIDDVTDDFFLAVTKAWPKLLAVEMEGTGAATAIESAQASGHRVGFVMVRGISDMPGTPGGGTRERDAWKRLAAEAAARFFFAVVRKRWPVEPLQQVAAEQQAMSGTDTRVQARGDSWRLEKRDAKRAEVAGEVLPAALLFLDGLGGITSVAIRTREGAAATQQRDDRAALRVELEARWDGFAEVSNRFVDAIHLAETFLNDEVNDLLKRVWDERASIKASQTTFLATPSPAAAEFFREGFGSAPEKRLAGLREECRRILRPIAQLG